MVCIHRKLKRKVTVRMSGPVASLECLKSLHEKEKKSACQLLMYI